MFDSSNLTYSSFYASTTHHLRIVERRIVRLLRDRASRRTSPGCKSSTLGGTGNPRKAADHYAFHIEERLDEHPQNVHSTP